MPPSKQERRVVSFSLPKGDPNSGIIAAWLKAMPQDTDESEEIRRKLAFAIQFADRLAAIEAALRNIQASGVSVAEQPQQAVTAALLDDLLDFE